MKKLSVEDFHNICFEYFKKKTLKIKEKEKENGNKDELEIENIFKIETTMEKWFQCEIVLSFVQEGFKVFSSEIYNEKYGPIDEKLWDSNRPDWKIITAEAAVYKNSRKKADIVIEKDDESIVCEIKCIWMYDEVYRNKKQFEDFLYKILDKNEVFEDAKKMQELAPLYKNSHRCLTIFASIDKKCFGNEKNDRTKSIIKCFEEGKKSNEIKNNFCEKITSYKTNDYSDFYKEKEYEFVIYLITLELNM